MSHRRFLAASLAVVFVGGANPTNASADDENYSTSIVVESNREAERALLRAEEQLRRGDLSAGLSQLQALLDLPSDSFVLKNGTYRSCWETANSLIATLSDQGRSVYHRHAGELARRMLDAARMRNDIDELLRVTDQYRHTPAGTEAAIQLAMRAVDRGDLRSAAAWLDFVDHALHFTLPSPALRGIRRRLEETLTDARRTNALPAASESRTNDATSTWSVNLGISNSAERAIKESLAEMDAQALNPTYACRPLIVGDRIVARTLTGVMCVDANTGERLWQHEIPSYAAQFARTRSQIDSPAVWNVASARLMRRIVRDSLTEEMASDGQTVFLVVVDDSAFNDLLAIDLSTGETTWRRGVRSGDAVHQALEPEFASDLADTCFFLGPPLVDDDQLLVLAQHRNVIQLLALDRQTGELRWTIPIGMAARSLDEDRERRSLACLLSKHGSDVYCPTGAGGIACVDGHRQRVRWVYRSFRTDATQEYKTRLDKTRVSEMPARDAWSATAAWRLHNQVIWVSAESDALCVLDVDTGSLIWTRPRGEGLEVRPLDEDGMLIVGADRVTARDLADGALRWATRTDRIVGRGVILNGQLVVPSLSGQLQWINLDDGTIEEPVADSTKRRSRIQIETHPPRDLRLLPLRNLVIGANTMISQSPMSLERRTVDSVTKERSPSGSSGDSQILADLLMVRTRWQPWLGPVRESDIRIALADAALTALFEATGLRLPVTEQIAALVTELDQSHLRGETEILNGATEKLQAFDLSQFSINTDQQTRSCRLDRWYQGWEADRQRQEHKRQDSAVSDRNVPKAGMQECLSVGGGADSRMEAAWPPVPPIVNDEESTEDPVYSVRVPMTVATESPWNDVTVEVDRQVRSVWFHAAGQRQSTLIRLPRGPDASRLDRAYLHAWAPADVLVLRIGTELIAFRREAGGGLPDTPLWPTRGRTRSTLGPRPPLEISLHQNETESLAEWNHASPGKVDTFDRLVAEVGPVRADYLCYQQRGHVIAIDMHSGVELWRRSRLPVGTRCLGDDDHVVLFHPDSHRSTVLRALDGQVVGEWDLTDAATENLVAQPSWSQMRLVRGTLGLFVHSENQSDLLRVVDLSSGEEVWRRPFPEQSRVFRTTACFLGLVTPAMAGSTGRIQFWNWDTGETLLEHQGTVPEKLQNLLSFSDAQRQYVIVSDRVTDRSLIRARQVYDGYRRPDVNGWLHAYDRTTGELLWESRLDNLAFPLDQPRHLPILVANDVVQFDEQQTPTGRLTCLDKRTGASLVSLSTPLHMYYSLEADGTRGEIALQLKRRTIRLTYSDRKSSE